MTNDKRQTGGRVGGSDFSPNQPSEAHEEYPGRREGRGYQAKKSDPPEKRTPPKGGSNVTPPPPVQISSDLGIATNFNPNQKLMTNSNKTINVCDNINCPFGIKKNGSFGCRKYLVAVHCHLLQAEDGSRRTNLERSSTQYYLYSYPDEVDLTELAEQNAKFLADSEIIEELEIEAEFGGP